jgi:hypothetical protein
MAAPVFVSFTDPETAYKAALGQDFFRKMKDDFDALNSRLSQVEGSLLLFDHFNTPHPRFFVNNGASGDPTSAPLLAQDARGLWVNERVWTGTGAIDPGMAYDGGFSELAIEISPNASGRTQANTIWSVAEFIFNSVTRPISFKSRQKWGGAGNPRHLIGLISGMFSNAQNPANAPTDGIWLEFPDSTNVRFICKDSGSGTTTGTSFTRPTTGTRYEIEIQFTDDPSNRALCYLNGVLKETFTTNLPVTRRLRAALICRTDTSGSTNSIITVDRARLSADGLADA